jgi:2-octaprenyl-6-methoxyphenol hydroxylase
MMRMETDIVIAGGGMVGASLAAALEPLGLKVLVVEPRRPGAPGQPSFDDRCTALAAVSRRIFQALACWEGIEASVCPITEIHVSDRGRFGQTRMRAAEQGREAFGYVAENRVLGRALWDRLESGPTDVLAPATVTDCETGAGGVRIAVTTEEGPAEIRSRLLVAADGVNSGIRKALGVGVTAWDYDQVAVVANVEPAKPHGGVAYERFAETGPMALLPMRGNRCSLVWTFPNELRDEVLAWSDDEFLGALQNAFGFRLGRFRRVGARGAYPLSLVRAEQQSVERVVFLGNAAHGLHPVAGQGFNLSLRDAAGLAECIADHGAQDPGAGIVLDRYSAWRRGDQRATAFFSDALIRIFGNPLEPVRIARNLGLLGLELFPPARAAVARQGMGLAWGVPRLARGVPLG